MPEPASGPVAVVLVGDRTAAAELAGGLERPAVGSDGAHHLSRHPAVVGLATQPWPGFTEEHDAIRLAAAPTPYYAVESWHRHPAYLDRLADLLAAARDAVGAEAHVLFTAPGRAAGPDGPDPEDVVFLRETAEAVSGLVGIRRRSIAWTSGDLGPSSAAALTALAEAHGRTAVLRCSLDPLGRPDGVADEAAALGLDYAETAIARDDLPGILEAVVRTVIEHEQLGEAL